MQQTYIWALTLASTVTSQLSASGGGIPDSVSSFQDSQEGRFGEVYVTGIFAREAWGSQMRGVQDHRRPMYATPGGAPASLRWKGRNVHPPSVFFASTCQI